MARAKSTREVAVRRLAARNKLLAAAYENYDDFQKRSFQIQNEIWSLLREYQSVSREFTSRRVKIIADAVAAEPSLRIGVQNDDSLLARIPPSHAAIWKSPKDLGIQLSFLPLEGFSWDASPPTSGSRLERALQIPSQHQDDGLANKSTRHGMGSSTITHENRSRNTEGEHSGCTADRSEAVSDQTNHEEYLRPDMKPPSSTIQHTSTTGDPLVDKSRRQSFRRKPFRNTIRKHDVAATKSWIFSYDSAGYPDAMYILRCPSSSCESAVFSRHPMRQGRAASHLKKCKVSFRNERDIVLRYAKQVVLKKSDPEPFLNKNWARKINALLITSDEPELAQENFDM